MFQTKRSLVVSSLIVVVGVGYVGFGYPTPLGVPQGSLYGHHEESRSAERQDKPQDRDSSRERGSREHASRQDSSQQHISQRWPSGTRRPSFGRSSDRKEKPNESEVSANESSQKESASSARPDSRERGRSGPQPGHRPGGSHWPPARPASFTPPPAWYEAPGQPALGGEPGILMPEPIRGKLKLDASQHRELDKIQQELDERLQEILTPEQFAKLEKLREEFLDQELGRREMGR